MTKVKDKALNTKDREVLLAFAKQNIKCPAEEADANALYDEAKPFVLAAVHKAYPPAEMRILEKYGMAQIDNCISYGGRYDLDSIFRFKSDAEAPLVPRYGGCRDRGYEWSEEAKQALFSYAKAALKLRKAWNVKFEDYRRLVTGSRMFSDVVTVWPAAEALRATIVPATKEQRALAVLSEDALARIKADNAGA